MYEKVLRSYDDSYQLSVNNHMKRFLGITEYLVLCMFKISIINTILDDETAQQYQIKINETKISNNGICRLYIAVERNNCQESLF